MAKSRGRPVRYAMRAQRTTRPSETLKKEPPPKEVVHDLGCWAAQKALIRRMDVSSPIIVDGGARVGNVTKKYLELFPNAHVHAFEPEPGGFATISSEFSKDSRVTVVNEALGSSAGNAPFFVGGQREEMSSLLPRAAGKRYYRHDLTELPGGVQVTTLDNYFYRKPSPHIIKLDLQGGELDALSGSRNILLRLRNPLMLYLEVLFVELYQQNPLLLDVWSFLLDRDYTLFDIYNLSRSKVNRRLKVADVLFVNRDTVKMLNSMPEEWLPKSLPLRLEKGVS